MSRWLELVILALALALVFAEENEAPKKPSDGMTDKQKEDMMEKMQNMHLYHDAFLGDHVLGFRDLSEADRAKKLQELIEKIDTDKDGLVSVDELKDHFQRVSKMYRVREIAEMMKDQDDNKDGKMSWEEFVKHNFGGDQDETQKEIITQDKKKFAFADTNGDSLLNLQEYHAFNHAIDDERMTQYAIDEHLEKHDKNKDGSVSYEEFEASFGDASDDSIKEELKKDFNENYDKDKNGKLTREEIQGWAIPDDAFVNEESPRLLKEADEDKDGKLSTAEITKHLDIFMDKPVKEEQGDAGADAPEGENEDAKSEKHDEL